ncbi:spore germination protein [Clostridium sediminicola]|uniref:GerAB/ArcD/ProY family transporter n=1 Tax=Clostridium sediminicola TaxID=3114879 RepID=UPI0031F20DDE
MNKQENLLTQNQLTFLLFSFVVGTGILKLPNAVVETAGQDAWISAIIALIYPIYLILIASYIINKHPKENILSLSKKYFGSLLGSILNFIFMMEFLITTVLIVSDFIILIKTYIVNFLTPLKIAIVAIFITAYGAYKGLKVLGKTSELISYIFIVVILFSISALKYGRILNLQPFLSSGLSNILKATITTGYSYHGWEALLLFYPYVEDTKAIKKSALKAVGLTGIIYVWVIFVTIFYLGIDIIPKSYWSFILVYESIHVPIINNFRYIFMFVWILISLRTSAVNYFAVAFNLNHLTKIDIKKLCLFIYPFVFYLSLKLLDRILRAKIVELSIPVFIIFDLIFFTLTALLIRIKNKN